MPYQPAAAATASASSAPAGRAIAARLLSRHREPKRRMRARASHAVGLNGETAGNRNRSKPGSLARAVSAPRIHNQWVPDQVYAEPGVPDIVVSTLKARGDKVVPQRPFTSANSILITPGGFVGAADPREGGALAVGGFVTAGLSYAHYKDLDGSCSPACDPSRWESTRTAFTIGEIVGIVGLVAAAGGVVWLLSTPSARATAARDLVRGF